MAEIHYSPIALNDLDEIWAYISQSLCFLPAAILPRSGGNDLLLTYSVHLHNLFDGL